MSLLHRTSVDMNIEDKEERMSSTTRGKDQVTVNSTCVRLSEFF